MILNFNRISTKQFYSLFLYGDSISIQYQCFLNEHLKDKFDISRKGKLENGIYDLGNMSVNGGDSSNMLSYFNGFIKKSNKRYDFLLLNSGLHDIKTFSGNIKQIDIKQYILNLQKTIRFAQKSFNKIIWITTTPVNDDLFNKCSTDFFRYNQDVLAYNYAANKLMKSLKVDIIDLYNFSSLLPEPLHYDGVHFNQNICALQSAFIAASLHRHINQEV